MKLKIQINPLSKFASSSHSAITQNTPDPSHRTFNHQKYINFSCQNHSFILFPWPISIHIFMSHTRVKFTFVICWRWLCWHCIYFHSAFQIYLSHSRSFVFFHACQKLKHFILNSWNFSTTWLENAILTWKFSFSSFSKKWWKFLHFECTFMHILQDADYSLSWVITCSFHKPLIPFTSYFKVESNWWKLKTLSLHSAFEWDVVYYFFYMHDW